jgi:penicillin-binding protein A
MTGPASRVLGFLLLGFAFVILAAYYWMVLGRNQLLQRSDNPRLHLQAAEVRRGAILDRNGLVLAETVWSGINAPVRAYTSDALSGVLGYSNLRYGSADLEAAFDVILAGKDMMERESALLAGELLNLPQTGRDIKITIDKVLSEDIASAFAGKAGAVVVIDLPSGDVLASVSAPTYDANRIETHWEAITTDPEKPLIDRAMGSQYQPGGILQTVVMAAALLKQTPLDQPYADGTNPYELGDLAINCAIQPPGPELTLAESYMHACPSYFARVATLLGPEAIDHVFEDFGLYALPVLQGLPANTDAPTGKRIRSTESAIANAVGQGDVLVSPLQLALITAAISQGGEAPIPRVLLGTRRAGTENWVAEQATGSRATPMTTDTVASTIASLMRHHVQDGVVQEVRGVGVSGAHAAIALSGDSQLAWYTGFASASGERQIVVAVVVEDADDVAEAIRIGEIAIDSALRTTPGQ